MNGCHEHGDTDVFYPDYFDLCPLCKAERDRHQNQKELLTARARTKKLAHALSTAPGPKRMDFMSMTYRDTEAYRKWYIEIREEALKKE